MHKIIKNFSRIFGKEDLFIEASLVQIDKLKELFGNDVSAVVNFYSKYQPHNVPMSNSYVQLIDINRILEENTNAEPGKYLAECGVYVFALTVGGNVLCIDTNDVKNGDASVLIADANFCSYNEVYGCVEIGIVPEEVLDQIPQNEILRLNYSNITKCLRKIEDSFMKFMQKLSNDEYEDIEEYLE